MTSNIKVDLIYYTIGTDFEMEFNLCGCCRMRLLTDAVTTRSNFAKSLARGVSRSNIIIVCGPMFGEKGLVSTVSKVTNIGTENIDNKRYGIEDNGKISVLKGSTPLVSSDGVFCGCIIENGPQVIILLTESKSLRKKVMKELVHPYISQWSVSAQFNSKPSNTTPPSPLSTPAISVSVDETDIGGETTEEQNPLKKLKNSDFIVPTQNAEEDEEKLTVNGHNDLYYNFASLNYEKTIEDRNMKYYLEDFDSEQPVKEKKKSLFLVFLIIFAVFIGLLILFFAVIRPMILGVSVMEFIRNMFTPDFSLK